MDPLEPPHLIHQMRGHLQEQKKQAADKIAMTITLDFSYSILLEQQE